VGWPVFALLGAAYFAMSYLLIGAAFLGIGAQASTVREVQTLSMPITMAQVGLFALASFAVNDHGNGALLAALFPLSSPFAMLARAALDPAILPHLAALAWQALWVSLILKGAAAWFRRAVLNGPGEKKRWWKRSPASAA
jgi:ABC-2 type transport system permease protein